MDVGVLGVVKGCGSLWGVGIGVCGQVCGLGGVVKGCGGHMGDLWVAEFVMHCPPPLVALSMGNEQPGSLLISVPCKWVGML